MVCLRKLLADLQLIKINNTMGFVGFGREIPNP